jgi:hypothetical protein
MKAYIIMEKGFEYDDNYYNPTEGGSPKKVYFKLEDAQKALFEFEVKNAKEQDISSYMGYEMVDDLNCSKEELLDYCRSLNEKYGTPEKKSAWDSFGDFQLNPKATDKEAQKFLNMINFRFFEIDTCEVDITSLRDHQIDSVLS